MSEYTGNLPLAFYANPAKARLIISSRKEANEIISYYEGKSPAYIGLGSWSLHARSMGAGVYEITCSLDN